MERSKVEHTDVMLHSWLRFIRQTGLSTYEKLILLKFFGNVEAIYAASHGELEQLIAGKNWSTLFKQQPSIEADLKWLEQENHHLVTWFCDAYPELLRQIPDAPVAFYAQGNIDLLLQPQVAMVGSRMPTQTGLKVASEFSAQLATVGLVVTSGLALGIDAAAHIGALKQGGQTLAVLGCGLDICYPAKHKNLAQKIAEQGLLISEFAIGAVPAKYHFPQRNRLISGLSYGVVIVEAAEKSGSLITARLAMEQNREVFAVPGSVLSPLSRGCHQLIREGAVLIQTAQQIIYELNLPLRQAMQQSANGEAISINPLIKYINYDATTIDVIISSSGLTAAEVSAILLELELDGHIAHCDDGKYVRLN